VVTVTEYQQRKAIDMNTDTTTSVWEFLERPDDRAPEAHDLYRWGLNCERDSNPFLVFLDLIGWSEENYGEHLVMGSFGSLGYVEQDYLGRALMAYALNPRRVEQWVTELMNCEGV
jgi:hypothetical protein